jgi:hypothetical protein
MRAVDHRSCLASGLLDLRSSDLDRLVPYLLKAGSDPFHNGLDLGCAPLLRLVSAVGQCGSYVSGLVLELLGVDLVELCARLAGRVLRFVQHTNSLRVEGTRLPITLPLREPECTGTHIHTSLPDPA